MRLGRDAVRLKGGAQCNGSLAYRNRDCALKGLLMDMLFFEDCGARCTVKIVIEHRGAAATSTLDTIFHGRVNRNRGAVAVPRSSKAGAVTCRSKRRQHFRPHTVEDK